MTDQQILTALLELTALVPVLMFIGHMAGCIRAGLAAPETAIVEPRTVPAMAAAVTAPRLVIPADTLAKQMAWVDGDMDDEPDHPTAEDPANYPTIQSAPIDWDLFGLRELRRIAKAVGVKGFGRMDTTAVKAAIEAEIS